MAWSYEFRPHVSAAERGRRAAREVVKRAKRGLPVEPIVIEGRAIARTFWGKAWCEHLEHYCDFENRLPRGRTYVRNGSVLHLGIEPRRIEALVQGSRPTPYEVAVSIAGLPRARWRKIVGACAGQIDSLVELLQGKLSSGVMKVVTDPRQGLFPAGAQMEMKCSCPDWATMCKHVASVLYGIGARLDAKPELLFVLRGVDHLELLDGKAAAVSRDDGAARSRIADEQLGSVFGIEIDAGAASRRGAGSRKRPTPSIRRKGAQPLWAEPTRTRTTTTMRSRPESAHTVDAIVALLRQHPEGLHAEQIRAALGVPAKELRGRITEGIAMRRLRKKGRRRATVYFVAR